ncbi:hypothetical protein Pcinc_008294 [Petrolisthes cinctipes]|uniref:Uncharacterized protein n=1 Tax=Petrolisthes cinctipes TaxID=88211 RepID=A0AAE1KZK7_PETCI|nr:hypothetical protein Pcinc_008294 [Petrolisthes cinctipes]
MVLGISYSSNLTAFLTVVRQPRSIDTFKELLDSDLPVVGLGPIFGNLMKTSVNVYLKELFKNFVPMPTEPELLVKEGRAGYLTSFHNSEYFVAQVNSEYSKPIVRSMKLVLHISAQAYICPHHHLHTHTYNLERTLQLRHSFGVDRTREATDTCYKPSLNWRGVQRQGLLLTVGDL